MMQHELNDAVRSMIRRGRLIKLDDSGTQQLVDLSGYKSEQLQKIVRIQPHGFSSYPNADAEGVMLQLAGRSDRTMFIGGEHKDHRPKSLSEGNAVLYDDKGNVLFAKGDGGLSVNAKTGVVEVRSQTDKVTVHPGNGKNVYLGGNGADGTYARVMTESGPSSNVYARV